MDNLANLLAETAEIKAQMREVPPVDPDPRTVISARQCVSDGRVVLVEFADGTNTQAGWSDGSALALACKRDGVNIVPWSAADHEAAQLAEKAAEIRATCEQEIATKANPQEQEGARNRIVLAMARKQAPLKADLDLLDWVEARRNQCETDVQRLSKE